MSAPSLLLLVVTVLSFGFFAWHVYRLWTYIRVGAPDSRFNKIPQRLKGIIVHILLQKRMFKDFWPGAMHLTIFWGFVILTIGTLEILIQGISPSFSLLFIGEKAYSAFVFSQEFFNVAVTLAILYAYYRRLILKPERLRNDLHGSLDALFILFLILYLMISNLGANSANLAEKVAAGEAWANFDQWCFASRLLAPVYSQTLSLDAASIHQAFVFWWWSHILVILGFLCYLPFSKHLHIIVFLPNVFFTRGEDRNRLRTLNLEDEKAESFGAGKIEDFTWKQLLDSYACTECGRCNTFCPTYTTDKPLQPKKLILDLRDHLLEKGKARNKGDMDEPVMKRDLVTEIIGEDVIWDCTTCMACVESCPILIEHVDKIVDMRRNLVLMHGKSEPEVLKVFNNWETHSNPWGIGYAERAAWAEGLPVKFAKEHPDAEFLYYVGCAASFDKRNQSIARAMVKILNEAGVDFAILGKEERCNGETARRLGNEYLAQNMIRENIEVLERYRVRKVITTCPHCFNTLKNEYPEFGGNYEVFHHTEIIAKLIEEGKIALEKPLEEIVAYHDSCYLGRYNQVYDAPREIISRIPGIQVVEFERSRAKGFCCGAGGGRMWMEEKRGSSRINVERVNEATSLSRKPDTIASACPFCLIMMEDGTKVTNNTDISTKDISELVAESMRVTE
ncbi:MAG: (Fe-S)-binding protein [Deltaproteobacteria bacterium]|nr:(Fe-S)-binding protein [Deltaproteobacteria bacterium]